MNSIETQSLAVSELTARAEEVLHAEPGLKLAILYGSAVTGRMRPDSDVDVALLFDRPLSAERKMALISRLESELRRDVDLVDLFSLNGTILKQVLCKGQVLIQTKTGELSGLVRKMIYNQTDIMPYVSRTLIERQRRFIYG
jgi:predicted nucleotidyltransferase